MHQNPVSDPCFILVNNPKKAFYATNSFKNKMFWKGIIESGTSYELLLRLRNKFTENSLLIIYYLTKFDGVIYSGVWVITKITLANLYKAIHDIIHYSTSICLFESRKCGKEEEKFEYLENERSFLDEIKNIFHSF